MVRFFFTGMEIVKFKTKREKEKCENPERKLYENWKVNEIQEIDTRNQLTVNPQPFQFVSFLHSFAVHYIHQVC